MTKRICDKCGYAYEAKCTAPNIIYFCPKCFNYVGCECEYGIGPIVPCSILLGGKQIAEIVNNDSNGYRLISSELTADNKIIVHDILYDTFIVDPETGMATRNPAYHLR